MHAPTAHVHRHSGLQKSKQDNKILMLGLKRNLKFEKRGLNIELGIYQRQGLHDVLQFLEPEFFVHPKKVPIWVRNSAIISNFRHWILAVVLQLTGHN